MKTIEDHRTFWANIAKENGWYTEPFYVAVWVDPRNGEIYDSLGTRQLTQDQEIFEEESYE